MQRRNLVGVLAVMAAFVPSMVVVTPAFATSEKNPQWEVGTTLLALGQEKPIEVKAVSPKQVLTASGVKIECTGVKVDSGAAIIGGEGETAGTNKETIVYEGCTVNGSPDCTVDNVGGVAGTIATQALKSTLVFETKTAAEKEESKTLTLFEPASGSVFVELELAGTCPSPGAGKYPVEGQVAVTNKEGSVSKQEHELEAPAKVITEYYTNKAGKTEKHSVTTFKVLHIANASYEGVVAVKLESGEDWAVFN
jgi:hypothetical protein